MTDTNDPADLSIVIKDGSFHLFKVLDITLRINYRLFKVGAISACHNLTGITFMFCGTFRRIDIIIVFPDHILGRHPHLFAEGIVYRDVQPLTVLKPDVIWNIIKNRLLLPDDFVGHLFVKSGLICGPIKCGTALAEPDYFLNQFNFRFFVIIHK